MQHKKACLIYSQCPQWLNVALMCVYFFLIFKKYMCQLHPTPYHIKLAPLQCEYVLGPTGCPVF